MIQLDTEKINQLAQENDIELDEMINALEKVNEAIYNCFVNIVEKTNVGLQRNSFMKYFGGLIDYQIRGIGDERPIPANFISPEDLVKAAQIEKQFFKDLREQI
jgi:hypothetical protein